MLFNFDIDEDEDEEEEEDLSFILYVSKEIFHEMFPNRGFRFLDEDGNVEHEIPIPHDQILCDGCNADMSELDLIPLYMIDLNRCYGAECPDCVERYFKNIPKYKIEDLS